MFNKNALRGFAMGMLAAIIGALGVWPVLAYDSDQLLLGDHQLALQADRSAGGSPGVEEEESDRVGAVDGVTGQWFGPSPLVIPAAAFSSDGFDPGGFFFSFGGGYIDGSGSACLKAPAYLPNGATVTSFYASLYDNAAGNITVNLWRVNRITGATDMMATAGTTTDSASIQNRPDSTISNPTVSYPDYAYYVTTCLDSASHRVYSIRIYYTTPVYLPIILKGF